MKKCYIIGAGDVDFSVKPVADESDFIICADGGYKFKYIFDKEPDLVVGDYDSLGYIPETKDKIIAPCEKDETDMMLAVNEGIKRGYTEFVIYGALGGSRFDHSVANIQLLSYICSKNAKGTIIHNKQKFTAFKNGELSLSKEHKGYISVFSLCDESRGVTIKNLKYEVENYRLRSDCPIAVSNEFVGKESKIAVNDGVLLVICGL